MSVQPLPVPSVYHKGDVPAGFYRKQDRGETPRTEMNLEPTRLVRTIRLKNGVFSGLASDTGALLTTIVTGELTLQDGKSPAIQFVPGDLFLIHAKNITEIDVTTQDDCCLVQIGVTPDWPRPDATLQHDHRIGVSL